jgi:hypothetical protein
MRGKNRAQYFESSAGDASASSFEKQSSEDSENKSISAFKVALRLIDEIKKGDLPPTRVGLYSGKLLQAQLNNRMYRFGNAFSAASRLLELCDYFDTPMLMDREVALAQKEDREFIACIGKITPKSLEHPIHVFTVYKPGVHWIPIDVDKKKLLEFIELKNRGIECFHGNIIRKIKPDFLKARKRLYKASILFKAITDQIDIASEKILKFIDENNNPSEKFLSEGIKFKNKDGYSTDGANLYQISRELLKVWDVEFYKNFVLNTQWQSCFRFQRRAQGDIIFKEGAEPDGVYFLTKGQVNVIDVNKNLIVNLKQGSVFGEMAYFSKEGVRNYTVTAYTDLNLYFISGKDFMEHPQIMDLFERIAQTRQ